MILVGDVIKQVKEIMGFNYVGREFEITGIEGANIAFKSSMGRGVMTLGEFEEYFEKVAKEPEWSEWKRDATNGCYAYRVKGGAIQYKEIITGVKVQSKCMECDTFDLETGLDICRLKMKLKQY
ncbi:MAG: hypothetical protein ACRC1P_09745 [Cellulosilyticaceae bacterium]